MGKDGNVYEVPQLYPKQVEFFKSTAKYTAYGGARAGGKIVSYDSSVLTPFGFKNGRELEVGDLINNPDGSVQRIIQIKPEVELEKWNVVFSDGTKLPVAKDHLWKAWKANKSRKIKNKRVSGEDSAEIIETQTLKEWLERGYTPQVPVCEAQPFNVTTKMKLMDSYLIGVLLGDGCTTSSNITLTCSNDDKEHYLNAFEHKYDVNSTTNQTIRFNGESNKEIKEFLDKLGLLGKKSQNKFIPRVYKYSSIDSRLELIRGLMDTDGYNSPNKGACYYYSVSKQLAEDVAFVLRSLGALVTITDKIGSYVDGEGNKVECRKCYKLYIRYKDADELFSLKRKKHGKKCQTVNKRVIDVEVGGTVKGRCITVSNPNGLYVTDDFIVTHNSFALREKLVLLCLYHPGMQILLIRRTLKDLRKNHEIPLMRKLKTETKTKRIARYDKQNKEFHFPNGSILSLGYAATDADLEQYQGQAYDVIGVEEATQFTEHQLRTLTAANRRSPYLQGEFESRMYFTCNPGGSGHSYIKRLFIDRDYEDDEDPNDYYFIQALVYDNPFILENDPGYVKSLENLPEEQRRAWLYGEWDVFTGQMFKEFKRDKHVVKPFSIPRHWDRYIAFDYGLDMTAALWFAVDEDGIIYVYKELHESDLILSDAASKMLEMTLPSEIIRGKIAPPDLWSRRQETGVSGEEIMIQNGLFGLRKADNDRVRGWRLIRELLRDKTTRYGDSKPQLQIFENCKTLIKNFPLLQADERKPEDAATEPHDITHIMDALRYFVATTRQGNSIRAPEPTNSEYEFKTIESREESSYYA
jgi:phage terminase large subunit